MLYVIMAQLAKMPAEYTAMFERLRPTLGKQGAFEKVREMYRLERRL